MTGEQSETIDVNGKHEGGYEEWLVSIEKRIDHGDYVVALKELDKFLGEMKSMVGSGGDEVEEQQMKDVLMFLALCLRSFSLSRQGKLDEALRGLEEAEVLKEELEASHGLLVNSFIEFIRGMILYSEGKLGEAESCFQRVVALKTQNTGTQRKRVKKLRGLSLRYLGSCHRIQGDLDAAEQYYKESLACFEELGDRVAVALSYNSLGSLEQNKGKFKRAKEYFERSLGILFDEDVKPLLAGVLNNISLLYQENMAFEKAIDLSLQSLRILEELGDERGVAMALTNLGVLYYHEGDFKNAEKFLRESIELKKKTRDDRHLALSFTNLGVVLFSKGEILEAKEYFLRARELLLRIGDSRALADVYENLGDVFKRQGKLQDALAMYQKSHRYRSAFQNPFAMAKTFLNLIMVYLELNDFDRAQENYNELKRLSRERVDPKISLLSRFGKALMLKSSGRLASKFQAMTIFKSIISSRKADFEIMSLCLQNMCELLFFELSITGNMEVLRELEFYTSRLQEIMEVTRSYITLTEVLLLKGKLALIHYDLNQAKALFSQAELIAQEKGLEVLAALAAREYDRFLGEISMLSEMFEKQASIQERLKYLNVEHHIQELVSPSVITLDLKPETPVLILLMMHASGVSLHSRQFHESSELDENLISSFLTAMNFFSQEAFSTAGQLERIIYQENTLVMKQEGELIVCYVFKGESYLGVKTVQTFIEELKKDEMFFVSLSAEIKEGLITKESRERIDEIIDRVILGRGSVMKS